MGNFGFAFINFICGISFYSIGVYASKKKTPMHFYSGDCGAIKSYQISDVKEYNNANSKMWKMYAFSYFVNTVLSFFNIAIGITTLFIISTIGLVLLIWYYECKIKKKYFIF